MTAETKQTVIGGLVVLGLALALALSYGGGAVKAKAGAGGYRISAVFNRIDGLLPGDEVRVGGVRVGTVERQSLDQHYRAVVDFWIYSGIRLPADTSAAIHTDGLFGSKYVVLEPGGDERMLMDGDRITFTQDALIVSELLDLIIAQGRTRQKQKDGVPGAASGGS